MLPSQDLTWRQTSWTASNQHIPISMQRPHSVCDELGALNLPASTMARKFWRGSTPNVCCSVCLMHPEHLALHLLRKIQGRILFMTNAQSELIDLHAISTLHLLQEPSFFSFLPKILALHSSRSFTSFSLIATIHSIMGSLRMKILENASKVTGILGQTTLQFTILFRKIFFLKNLHRAENKNTGQKGYVFANRRLCMKLFLALPSR